MLGIVLSRWARVVIEVVFESEIVVVEVSFGRSTGGTGRIQPAVDVEQDDAQRHNAQPKQDPQQGVGDPQLCHHGNNGSEEVDMAHGIGDGMNILLLKGLLVIINLKNVQIT